MIRRAIYNELKKTLSERQISVLIGSRQVGKTFLMRQLFEELAEGEQKIFLLGDDPEAGKLFQSLEVFENFLRIQGLDPDKRVVIFIDEFQMIDHISERLKWFYDENKNFKFVISGSSSLNISKNLKESLVGRTIVFHIHPISFEEFLSLKNVEAFKEYKRIHLEKMNQAEVPSFLLPLFWEYTLYGGYPAVVMGKEDKVNLLDNIVNAYIFRDVKSYLRNISPTQFNQLVTLLASQTANLLSVHNLQTSLGISHGQASEFLFILEELFILERIAPFSSKKSNEILQMPKLFFRDTGIRNMILKLFTPVDARVDKGALVENAVFSELRKMADTLTLLKFWRTKQGTEIDFLLSRNEKRILIEVKTKSFGDIPTVGAFDSFTSIYGSDVQRVVLHSGSLLKRQENTWLVPLPLVGKIQDLLLKDDGIYSE